MAKNNFTGEEEITFDELLEKFKTSNKTAEDAKKANEELEKKVKGLEDGSEMARWKKLATDQQAYIEELEKDYKSLSKNFNDVLTRYGTPMKTEKSEAEEKEKQEAEDRKTYEEIMTKIKNEVKGE